MIRCTSCGYEAPDDFAFCPKCATALAATLAIPEERKVVTTLFCDLVGFTAMSEVADPEDVDRVLGEYFSKATRVIESHGGTIEKFIGDAVVGVFGVPVVREDDPERAVRAGLRLLESLTGLTRPEGSPLEARCGVNTGEVLVRLDVDPLSGRGFLTGDAVNTAARLQAAAPPGGVAVGALTHELTERAIVYEELSPVAAKGKAELVAAWRARAPLARTGADIHIERLTPLVGREAELARLRALLDEVISTASPRSALLIGEPGIGKTRLVQELFASVDAGSELITWRQGRCPSYDEGVTFAAVSEIAKAHAGILDTDDLATAEAKLLAVMPDGPDQLWMANRLRALVGLEAPDAGPEENFAAWLRFIESLARSGPLVLVLEDLHWADDGLLDFFEHLAARSKGVPLLLVGTARHEFLERRPAFANDGGHVAFLPLEPLTRKDTERLVAGLAGDMQPAARVALVADRCRGNPFFAEECARLLSDVPEDSVVPASIQAVVAARLDALPRAQKALLGDASVVGARFWNGAVAELAHRDTPDVDAALAELAARRLIRRARNSSMTDQDEFAFAHALVRDVVYGQLPRRERASRHVAAARWLETNVGERADDIAEILAHHYATALDLSRVCGDVELAGSLTAPTLRHLRCAGERAARFDLARADEFFSRGLSLAVDERERAELLSLHAHGLIGLGRIEEAAAEFAQAEEILRRCGSDLEIAQSLFGRSGALTRLNDAGWLAAAEEAQRLLEGVEPSVEHVKLWTRVAATKMFQEDNEAVLFWADRAISLAERLGLPTATQALQWRGWARAALGDRGGIEDMRRAVDAAAPDHGYDASSFAANLAMAVFEYEGPQAALLRLRDAEQLARSRGAEEVVTFARATAIVMRVNAGDWNTAMEELARLPGSPLETACNVVDLMVLRSAHGYLGAACGDRIAVDLDWLRAQGERCSQTELAAISLVACALVDLATGDARRGAGLLARCATLPGVHSSPDYAMMLPAAVRAALKTGDVALAKGLVGDTESVVPLHAHGRSSGLALLAEAGSEHEAAAVGFAEAALQWHDFGVPYEEAQALLGQGRCLVALGRAAHAAAPVAAARAIFARLGARPALAEADSLLRQVSSA